MHFTQFTPDLLKNFALFLNPKDILEVSKTCRFLQGIFNPIVRCENEALGFWRRYNGNVSWIVEKKKMGEIDGRTLFQIMEKVQFFCENSKVFAKNLNQDPYQAFFISNDLISGPQQPFMASLPFSFIKAVGYKDMLANKAAAGPNDSKMPFIAFFSQNASEFAPEDIWDFESAGFFCRGRDFLTIAFQRCRTDTLMEVLSRATQIPYEELYTLEEERAARIVKALKEKTRKVDFGSTIFSLEFELFLRKFHFGDSRVKNKMHLLQEVVTALEEKNALTDLFKEIMIPLYMEDFEQLLLLTSSHSLFTLAKKIYWEKSISPKDLPFGTVLPDSLFYLALQCQIKEEDILLMANHNACEEFSKEEFASMITFFTRELSCFRLKEDQQAGASEKEKFNFSQKRPFLESGGKRKRLLEEACGGKKPRASE